ncbi:MAG: tetratricopeptide repeat protein [Thermoguttaceae bacterium]|jgi:tetratricopeptide (TPR) repeat protein
MSEPRQTPGLLDGKRVAVVGRLASMPRREAAQFLRSHGAVVLDQPDATTHLVVLGEQDLPLPEPDALEDWFDESLQKAVEQGTLEVLTETQLWQRLGQGPSEPDLDRLYTPAMLAELLHVPLAVIRRWHGRGLIVPARQVRRLPYFDFHEVATARRLAALLAAGVSPQQIEKKLAVLARLVPGVGRPLAQLSVIIHGKEILLRQGDGLIEPGGQLRFDFESWELGPKPISPLPRAVPARLGEGTETSGRPLPADDLRRMAAELEESGQLADAAEMYRAAMAAAGPDPETCFQLAELLYRLGDLAAARERYYMAIELDEDYVEARANLGCVLAETGQRELAVAAFEGALGYHGGYADVHYHLARTLDEMGRAGQAQTHWRTFLAMAPDSPWAEEARGRLAGDRRQ